MSTATSELLSDASDRARIREVWCALEAACQPRYWLRWAWIETWLDSLPPELRPSLVLVRVDDQPVAAFFLRAQASTRHRVLRSKTAYLNEVGSARYDILHIEYNRWLHDPAVELDVGRVLASLPIAWEELIMNGLDLRAMPGRALRSLQGRYRVHVTGDEPSPWVDLEAVRSAPGGYLSLLGASTRAAIRRSRKAYADRGAIELTEARNVSEARAFIAELADLSLQRFEGTEGSSFRSPYFQRFHDSLIERRFAHGEIQILRLRAGRTPIGVLYNLVSDGVVHFYQSGFHYEGDNRFRPGLLLHAEAIEHASRLGLRIYDFLGGSARYKRDLSTHQSELMSVRIQRPLVKFLVEGQLKELRAWARDALRRRDVES